MGLWEEEKGGGVGWLEAPIRRVGEEGGMEDEYKWKMSKSRRKKKEKMKIKKMMWLEEMERGGGRH